MQAPWAKEIFGWCNSIFEWLKHALFLIINQTIKQKIKVAFTLIYILMACILIYILIYAFNNYSARPAEKKFLSPESILLVTPLCSHFVSWEIDLLITNFKKICLSKQLNNYSIPHKIRPFQENIEIVFLFTSVFNFDSKYIFKKRQNIWNVGLIPFRAL